MQAWSVVVPILVAVLAGAAIPLLFQLWATVRSARRVVDRMDRVTARLDEGQRLDELIAAIDGVTRAAKQLGEGVKIASAVGAAIGPAAAAAVQAWRASQVAPVEREPQQRNGVNVAREERREEERP